MLVSQVYNSFLKKKKREKKQDVDKVPHYIVFSFSNCTVALNSLKKKPYATENHHNLSIVREDNNI